MSKEATLEYLIQQQLNNKTAHELNYLGRRGYRNAMKAYSAIINKLQYGSRKMRSEKRENLLDVLSVLILYLKTDKIDSWCFGQCSPSMRTITYALHPELIPQPYEVKNPLAADNRKKEKAFNAALMKVQRTIRTLSELGFIKIHTYRATSNQRVDTNPNFFYEIVPISELSAFFARLVSGMLLTLTRSSVFNLIRTLCDEGYVRHLDRQTALANFLKKARIYRGSIFK